MQLMRQPKSVVEVIQVFCMVKGEMIATNKFLFFPMKCSC